MPHSLSLPSGKVFTLTRSGLKITGEITQEEWKDILTSLQAVKHSYHCCLGDVINYGRVHFGDNAVAAALEQLEFEIADITKADAIGQLTLEFREDNTLSSEHYFVLSALSEADRIKWAKTALKHKLSALELKRSIEQGKVIRLAEIQSQSGHGTGISTIQGVVFRMQQWEKSMGGSAMILSLPIEDRKNLLTLLTPAIELASAIEQSLGATGPNPPPRLENPSKLNKAGKAAFYESFIIELEKSDTRRKRQRLLDAWVNLPSTPDQGIQHLMAAVQRRKGTNPYVTEMIVKMANKPQSQNS